LVVDLMSRIAIASLTISPGDAVSNDALEMQRILSAVGHHVGLFSSQWLKKNPATRDLSELADFLAGDPRALLIYHHSTGWSAGVDLLRRTTCRRIVRYHNVTPGRFFAGFSPDMVRVCQLGREQLRDLARADCDLYLSDSLYNQGELIDAGAAVARCAVLPPFHHIDRLQALPADVKVLDLLDDGRTNLLFVGRRAPNKGHRYLLDAFAVYHEHYDRNSRLLLVGRDDRLLAGYTNLLREQASRLGVLESVIFVDGVSDAELKAYYQRASVFVLASEHEGFCVPLVEAMALRLPIVAYGTTAVPHTLGDGGLIWDEPDPFLLAQSIATVVQDERVRQQLTERGRRRYQERFTNQRLERDFLHALKTLAA
jgi:glycosyltransferase involved in cell wall biosynthesis